jgi:hypothetical protein
MHGAVSSQETQDTDALDEREVIARGDNDDVALALALAQSARTVEHVVDLGVGRYGVAVTYGPGKRIRGIVLRRPTQSGGNASSSIVEAHIVVATAAVSSARTPTTQRSEQRMPTDIAHSASGTQRAPILLQIADDARRTLAATLWQLRPNENWAIDITIDDLRDMDEDPSSGAL